jgi:hypothetical protein
MQPVRHDLLCKAGTTFRKSFIFKAGGADGDLMDFTGFTARMQVRPAIDSDTVLVTLSTEDLSNFPGPIGSMEFVLEDGKLKLFIPASVTQGFAKANYYYDIEIVSADGIVDTPLFGRFKVVPEVTRAEV